MRERPILFSSPMVRAILDGRKTQTRRLMSVRGFPRIRSFGRSETPGYDWTFRDRRGLWQDFRHNELIARCPYGVPGDRLWVREAWASGKRADGSQSCRVAYRADGMCVGRGADGSKVIHGYLAGDTCGIRSYGGKWRPSIHMPRWASRITLEVTGVRLEQLQDISEADATAEGVDVIPLASAALTHRTAFAGLWDHINAKRGHSWASNPWVWVVEFRRVAGNDDE